MMYCTVILMQYLSLDITQPSSAAAACERSAWASTAGHSFSILERLAFRGRCPAHASIPHHQSTPSAFTHCVAHHTYCAATPVRVVVSLPASASSSACFSPSLSPSFPLPTPPFLLLPFLPLPFPLPAAPPPPPSSLPSLLTPPTHLVWEGFTLHARLLAGRVFCSSSSMMGTQPLYAAW